jgi:hypothetical protein
MQIQITRISPFQTSKVIAALYFVVTIPFLLLFGLISMFVPDAGPRFSVLFVIFAPVIYAVLGFVFCFIGAYIYNFVARFVGGIEFTATETRDF